MSETNEAVDAREAGALSETVGVDDAAPNEAVGVDDAAPNEADSAYVIPTDGVDSSAEAESEVVTEIQAVAEVAADAGAVEAVVDPEPAAQIEPDPVLLAAREQARAALAEITAPQTIGAEDGHEAHEAHVLTLYFECRLPGYPGWRWAATLARVDEESDINVLEVELLPGAGAVIAPEWVPWSQRLAQFRETQSRQAVDEATAAEEAAAELTDEDEIDPEDDLLENDFSDFDDEIDGVDIDEEDDESDDDESNEDDESDDDESGEDDESDDDESGEESEDSDDISGDDDEESEDE
ncbi:DUF3027 domain-containing protein [Leucobacter sp. Z1108]|uniref:DUF3027 domain-containing protein n=1 Tax=Leucobacter sp. Z1108 TaxID=3439066 RepID=UPI003F33B0CB